MDLAPRAGSRSGGGGLSANPIADLAVVAEEMGRQVAPGPLLPVNVVVDALARGGQPELVDEIVPGLMAGDTDRRVGARRVARRVGRRRAGRHGRGPTGPISVVSGHKRFVEARRAPT